MIPFAIELKLPALLLSLILLFTVTGGMVLVFVLEVAAMRTGRSMYDKGAHQLAFMNLIVGWLLLVGSRVWLFYSLDSFPQGSLPNFLIEVSWVLFSIAILLGSLHYVSWKMLGGLKLAHVCLAMFGWLQAVFALCSILLSLRLVAAMVHVDAATMQLADIFPLGSFAPQWKVLLYSLPCLVVLPASIGGLWLFMRRNTDNYGRDYYKGMTILLVSVAQKAWIALLVCFCAMACLHMWLEPVSFVVDCWSMSLWLLIWILPLFLWHAALKADVVFRHMGGMAVAAMAVMSFIVPYYEVLTRF